METNKIADYEKATDDAMSFLDADVNLSPETYIHYTLMRMTDSIFLSENLESGFAKYAYLAQHAESIFISSKNDEIKERYYLQVKQFEDELNKQYAERADKKTLINKELSLKRINLIMSYVFDRKSTSEPLKA